MLVYTNTATGTNVRIQEMFRLVGRCGYLACGKYVAVSGANPLHLKNIFRMHYKNEHGETAPDNFNAPDHYDVVKFFDKSLGGGAGNVHDVTKIPDKKKIFTDINKKASAAAKPSPAKGYKDGQEYSCQNCQERLAGRGALTRHWNEKHGGQDINRYGVIMMTVMIMMMIMMTSTGTPSWPTPPAGR